MMRMPGGEMRSPDGFTANGETAIVDISGATILLEAASAGEDNSEGTANLAET